MKNRSLNLVLNIRYWSSIIYYFCMLCYGIMIIFLYGVEDIGLIYGVSICVSFLIALLCIMIKAETLLKKADPLNINNRKLYVIIMLLESSELVIAFVAANFTNESHIGRTIAYCVYCTLIFLISRNIHGKIINDYKVIKNNSKFEEIIDRYLSVLKSDIEIDINLLFNNFMKFTLYIISLVFVYEYTLYSWILTLAFVFLNIFILWRFHWTGIKKIIKYKYFYFGAVCFISSCGIVLLKLVYDKVIYISVFQGRDAQEYLMVLILFFLPVTFYGGKVSVRYINQTIKWVE